MLDAASQLFLILEKGMQTSTKEPRTSAGECHKAHKTEEIKEVVGGSRELVLSLDLSVPEQLLLVGPRSMPGDPECGLRLGTRPTSSDVTSWQPYLLSLLKLLCHCDEEAEEHGKKGFIVLHEEPIVELFTRRSH